MLRLDRVIKSWKESGALNSQINLYGFWNEHTFITKSGDLGIVLQLQGVDYESLDQAAQEYAVKRLEAALKTFGPGFHIYQYLLKSNRPTVPFQHYVDPVVQPAGPDRSRFVKARTAGTQLCSATLRPGTDRNPRAERIISFHATPKRSNKTYRVCRDRIHCIVIPCTVGTVKPHQSNL